MFTGTNVLILLSGLWVISSIAVVVLISRATHSIGLVRRHIDDVGNGIIQTLGQALVVVRDEATQARGERTQPCTQTASDAADGRVQVDESCTQQEHTCIQDAAPRIRMNVSRLVIVYEATHFADGPAAGDATITVRMSRAERAFLDELARQNELAPSAVARELLAAAFDVIPRRV